MNGIWGAIVFTYCIGCLISGLVIAQIVENRPYSSTHLLSLIPVWPIALGVLCVRAWIRCIKELGDG